MTEALVRSAQLDKTPDLVTIERSPMAIGSLIPMIAAVSSAGRQAIISRFAKSGATSPGSAIPFSPRNSAEGRTFSSLRRQGIIREAGHNQFYLIENELAASLQKQLRLVRVIGATAAVALTAAFLALR
jgi:hypothetical protein